MNAPVRPPGQSGNGAPYVVDPRTRARQQRCAPERPEATGDRGSPMAIAGFADCLRPRGVVLVQSAAGCRLPDGPREDDGEV